MLGLSTTPIDKNLRGDKLSRGNYHPEKQFNCVLSSPKLFHVYPYIEHWPSPTLTSNHLFLCDRTRKKVQGEFCEVAGFLPGQVDRHVVRIAVKFGRPHHHLEISSFKPSKTSPTFCPISSQAETVCQMWPGPEHSNQTISSGPTASLERTPNLHNIFLLSTLQVLLYILAIFCICWSPSYLML